MPKPAPERSNRASARLAFAGAIIAGISYLVVTHRFQSALHRRDDPSLGGPINRLDGRSRANLTHLSYGCWKRAPRYIHLSTVRLSLDGTIRDRFVRWLTLNRYRPNWMSLYGLRKMQFFEV